MEPELQGYTILSEHLHTKWQVIQARIAETHVARRVTEAFLRARSRVHLARLDKLSGPRCHANTLLGLVHRARGTRFGVQHDFARIRTEEDFRRLVPVTSNAALARAYWQPSDAPIAGSTWPTPLAGLASYNTGERQPRQVLLSPQLFAARRLALQTALALVFDSHPLANLLSGPMLFLDGPSNVSPATKRKTPTAVEVLRASLPVLYRPYCVSAGDDPADTLAQQTLGLPLTCVSGTLAEITGLFERVKRLANREKITEVWPRLLAVLYSCRPSERGLAESLRKELGPKVSLLEIGQFPEGFAAVEDPRHGLLRLLPDHGLYYEFIPAAECGRRAPQRVGLAQVEVGVDYELALTSPAGVWACRAGAAVRFERLDPPLLRFVEMPRRALMKRELVVLSAQDAQALDLKAPVRHQQTAGSPAARPESFDHNPWLVPVDRE